MTALGCFEIERVRRIQTASVGVSQGLVHPDRVASFHDLLYIQEGAWEVYDENTRYDLGPGDTLLLMAGRHHHGGRPCSPGTRWTYVHFDVDPADRFSHRRAKAVDNVMRVELPIHVSARRDRAYERQLEDIVSLHRSLLPVNRQRARLRFCELLVDLEQRAQDEFLPLSSPIMRVLGRIESRVHESLGLDDLAAVAGMSRRRLTREFRRATGQSARAYQLAFKVRVLRAHLTDQPELTLKELAAMLGFYDEYHLSRTFKRIVGVSPSEYRSRRGFRAPKSIR